MDGVANIFKKGSGNNSLSVNGKEIVEGPNAVKTSTVKIFESQKLKDSEIKDYAQQLAGTTKLIPSKDGKVFVAKMIDGQQVILRDLSSSAQKTGARWTIEIHGNKSILNNINRGEKS